MAKVYEDTKPDAALIFQFSHNASQVPEIFVDQNCASWARRNEKTKSTLEGAKFGNAFASLSMRYSIILYFSIFPEKNYPGNGTENLCPGTGRDGKRDKTNQPLFNLFALS